MAQMPPDGSRVIVTTTDHRQLRGTLHRDPDREERAMIHAEGGVAVERVWWSQVWACRVIEEGKV